MMFQKAVKHDARGRVALIGPAGSGKSLTSLIIARRLAGPGGRIAAIDTERGSLSKYADVFDFDVIELSSFEPAKFLDAMAAAEQAGYAAFICDSLSHFWEGDGGALDFVDERRKVARARNGDLMEAWKDWRPHERAMVNAMTSSPMHVIATMRVKTEYQDQVDPRTGNKKRVKIGLQPTQRAGLEYEFDLVGYMSDENELIIDKTRVINANLTSPYAGKAFSRPSAATFDSYAEWLKGAARPAAEAPPERPWQTRGQMVRCFADQRARVSEADFAAVMWRHGVTKPEDFAAPEAAAAAYAELAGLAGKGEVAA